MTENCMDCKKEIDNLHGKTNSLEIELAVFKADQKHYMEVLEKVADSNEKFANTLQNMEVTFTKMEGKINDISKDNTIIKQQVSGIDNRMKKVEADNSFNIMGFFNKNFPWIVVGVGALIMWASKFIKF